MFDDADELETLEVIRARHERRCVIGVCVLPCVGVCVCVCQRVGRRPCFYVISFSVCLGMRPSKENTRPPPHEDDLAAGRRQSELVCENMLSSPVSCQNRKSQGRKWTLGKCCLDVCRLEVRPWLTVTLPVRKNSPVKGVTPQQDTSPCYFYHFCKAQRGDAFPSC